MSDPDKKTEQALKLIEQLVRISPNPGTAMAAMQMRERLLLPMSVILARVPGDSITERAAKCNVSRQAYYAWLRGMARPSEKQAKRLARLTGYRPEDIVGRMRKLSRETVTSVTAAAARRASRPTRPARRV
jgi:transcriptional regulator with XRE-family HTH domain